MREAVIVGHLPGPATGLISIDFGPIPERRAVRSAVKDSFLVVNLDKLPFLPGLVGLPCLRCYRNPLRVNTIGGSVYLSIRQLRQLDATLTVNHSSKLGEASSIRHRKLTYY
jgi:hypothetical protein